MELTETHIAELYKFTRKHFVEHYDVQTELVDHLANDIEQICTENPIFSFKQARDSSFKKFGVFGFMNVVESRHKQLSKKYYKTLWSIIKEWFTVPKIIITASIFTFFYILISLNIDDTYLSVLMLGLAFVDVLFASRLSKKMKQRFKENSKKYLLEEIIFRVGAFSGILVSSNIFQITSFLKNTESIYVKVAVSSC